MPAMWGGKVGGVRGRGSWEGSLFGGDFSAPLLSIAVRLFGILYSGGVICFQGGYVDAAASE